MTWMKRVKRRCQEQYWKDKVREGKEHTLVMIHSALGKKAPGKVITWGLPSNQFLSHTTTEGHEHYNCVSYKSLAVFHLSTEHTMYQYPGQELRILSYPGAQRCDLLKRSSAHSLVVTLFMQNPNYL